MSKKLSNNKLNHQVSTSNVINYFIYQFPWQLFMVLIFILSSIPGDNLPQIEFHFTDKIAHFFIFGLFGSLLYRGLFLSQRFFWQKYSFILTLLICAFYGALDEVHQIYIPGRFASLSDWVADVLGAIIIVTIYRKRVQKKSENDTT